eukprot:12172_1
MFNKLFQNLTNKTNTSNSPHSNQNSPPIHPNPLLQTTHNTDSMQPTLSQHSHRSGSPIFNLLQDQNLMNLNNDTNDLNEEEKKQEDDEKQNANTTNNDINSILNNNDNEPLSDDDDDDNGNNAEEDIVPIDDEKTSEPNATASSIQLQSTNSADVQEIPEDEKQSASNTIHETHDSTIKQIEDQKVNNSIENDTNHNTNNDEENTLNATDEVDKNEASINLPLNVVSTDIIHAHNGEDKEEIKEEQSDADKDNESNHVTHDTNGTDVPSKQDILRTEAPPPPPQNELMVVSPAHVKAKKKKKKKKVNEDNTDGSSKRKMIANFNDNQLFGSSSSNKTKANNKDKSRTRERRKWPRELGLSRLSFSEYKPQLRIHPNDCILPAMTDERNKRTSLLWFVHEKLDDHLLDRVNYHTFAITAQLIAYPLSYNSSQLRVIDRFYHRFAHHFHFAYFNQLKKQTFHATKEEIADDTFYGAIGGRDVSRRSLIIPSDISSGKEEAAWIDLDGSQLVPSAIAGIQTNGIATIFFIRIPDNPEEALVMKVESKIKTLSHDALYSSIRWHPTCAHTLLIADKNVIRVFQIDRDFDSTTNVLTINPPNVLSAMKETVSNMIISHHYSFDSYLLMALNGPQNKSYGLISSAFDNKEKFETELDEINFLNIYKLNKYDATDKRRVNAKHLDDITDYDRRPVLIAHLDHETLHGAVKQFDAQHNNYKEYVELFQHCVMIQPPVDSALSSKSQLIQQGKPCPTYFFATVSKCIGEALSFVTIWALIQSSSQDDDDEEYTTHCLQRLALVAPSINTLITSMEYNRYSRPYLILTSTSFDPFQSNYMESRKRYIEDRVLIDNSSSSKIFRHRFEESSSKPIIYVDFTQLDSDNPFQTMFHSYMISLDWLIHDVLAATVPFVNTVLCKSDTSPCPQLIPCRSLYRFVESSLIGQKSELKKLKLYTRRATIGLLRVGVFAFKYFELYTPESIKLRRSHQQQQQLAQQLRHNTQLLKQQRTKQKDELTMASYLYDAAAAAAADETPKKKSEQQFYSRLDKMLREHHATFLNNLDAKMNETLRQTQNIVSQKNETVQNNTAAVESLTQKWNCNPPLNRQDMEQVLSTIISDKIMPKFGVYMMTMFKNFCNNWIVPSINTGIEKAIVDTNALIIGEFEKKMKNITTSNEDIKQITTNYKTAAVPKAILSDKANVQIANLVNKQLRDTLKLINQSLSDIIQKQLQKSLTQIQRELNNANSSLSSSFQNQITDSIQQQFKSILNELKHVQTSQAGLSSKLHSLPHTTYYSSPPHTQQQQLYDRRYNNEMHSSLNDKLMALQMQLDKLQQQTNRDRDRYYQQQQQQHHLSSPPYYPMEHRAHHNDSSSTFYYEQNDTHLYSELQGKISELMSEYEQKMKPQKKKEEVAAAVSAVLDEDNKDNKECLLLMQQFCDSSQPFHAIDAMMKYKRYDFVIDILDKYDDIETLFKKHKGVAVITFDLLNQLLWLLADLIVSNDARYSSNHHTAKFVEWMSCVLENVNAKKMRDFNMNSLLNTLTKIESNLARCETDKEAARSVKYLNLLIHKWKSHQSTNT